VLLPLAALAILRATSTEAELAAVPWFAPGIGATVATVAGLALLVAVAAALEDGRVRDLADLAGFGLISVAFTLVTIGATGTLGFGLGMASAGAAFLVGSVAHRLSIPGRRGRVFGLIGAFVLVEVGMAAILLAGSSSIDERVARYLLGGAAAVLALGAVAGLGDPARLPALGIAASSAAVMAVAGSGTERTVGAAGMALAALVLGWWLLVDRLQRAPSNVEPLKSPEELNEPPMEVEYSELSRLTHELRATLDDLVTARHLIELQRLEIGRVSSADPLTGLAGRWPTLDRLRTEAAEARRYAHPVALVLVDIDHFAELNHEHGLEVGDAILREIAFRLRLRSREADALGRIGADSFVAILPHTDEAGATAFAQAVLDRLLERRVIADHGETTVTLSVGIALMRPGMKLTGDELLAAAEEALASAKRAGGNRIAFDRAHGLARLDERRRGGSRSTDKPDVHGTGA
jgi:diguanylate cyclase (GGDEF)-like protein